MTQVNRICHWSKLFYDVYGYPSNTYWGCDLNATLGFMLLSSKLLYCLQLLSNSTPGRGWPKCYVQSHRWPIGQCCLEANYFIFSGSIQFNAWVRVANVHVPPSVDIDFCFSFKFMQFWTDFAQIKNQPKIVGNYCILGILSPKIFGVLFPNLKTWDWP